MLLVSSELDEILELADEILVLHRGKVSGRVAAANASRVAIARLMTGGDG